MSDEKAVVPVDQRTVEFYGDEVTAVLINVGGRQQVFVPVRPICDFLGVAWSPQRRRILRDPVLSKKVQFVTVTVTDSYRTRGLDMLCIPLDYLNGWLFGLNADRVKTEIRSRIIRYQEECYQILATAFVDRPLPAESPAVKALEQIREMGRAIMQMAEQQLEFERRVATTESRLDKAAVFMGDIGRRVASLEQRLDPGNPITDEQAAEVQAAVKALAMLMTGQDSSKNHFQSIFNELYRRFKVTSYKLIPQSKYPAVMQFLQEWHGRIVGN
ncbi:MAG: ORF6C domain-containing protein [Chloroflexi bacterium]|nr:ORF6C domain-containing protein [Chloroflexota bacterium]MCI0645157.1 ORF6C domain-containing protein [Chloroflexota bacterium]MCI0725637.1 ORF6C domain-containing protein [Chloroflexota bacterium]